MIMKPCDIIYQLYDALEGFSSTDIIIQTLDSYAEDVSNGYTDLKPEIIYQHIMSMSLDRDKIIDPNKIYTEKLSRLSRALFKTIPIYIQWKILENINGLKPVNFDRNFIYYTEENHNFNMWSNGSTTGIWS